MCVFACFFFGFLFPHFSFEIDNLLPSLYKNNCCFAGSVCLHGVCEDHRSVFGSAEVDPRTP